MKEATNLWRRRAVCYIAGSSMLDSLEAPHSDGRCLTLVSLVAASTPPAAPVPLGPSDRPEAYFNGSSYIRLSRPISLKQLVGLSYRTCVGGELFSQRFEGYTLHVTALFERVVVSWARPAQAQREVALRRATLDNRWHWLALRYRPAPPALLLEVDTDTQVIANTSWHSELVWPGALEAGGAVVLVGNVFSGCIHEGPQLEFHAALAQHRHVVFGHCPLTTDECKDRKDVLRIPPKDHCYNEPCMRHGTCISRHDRYECHCTARYSGNNCEVDAGDPCASAPCRNNGRCLEDAAGDVSCDCQPPYHGQFCELELSQDPQCVAGGCRNNGSCVVPPQGGAVVCVCAPGFTGPNCETDIDECAGAACLNGGACVDGINNYTCDCTGTGYTGARCENNVNECLERGLCGHGVCYDTYGGYVCACLPGYSPPHCQPTAATSAGCGEEGALCPPHAHCMPTNRAPNLISGLAAKVQVVCVCDTGYFGASGLSPNCTLASGACAAGVCLNGGTCVQGDDHFNCSCVPPYRGTYCETTGAAGSAPSGAASGKALSELKAERCAAQPCVHAASCVDTATGFHCECEAGWGGARCDEECVESGGTRRCVPAGAGAGGAALAGAPAPTPASPCASAPCHNGSCSVSEAGLVLCRCPPGANGRFCELDIDECALMPKICNHGVCVNVPGSYQCYCRPGYTGDSCEQDIDECLSSPCKNGGTCQNLENNYECSCVEGYTGKDCSMDINECSSNPCAAGATCVDGLASYSCVCGPGLTGARCQLDVDDCESMPCQNGGRCVDGLNSYTCECAGTGFSGPDCSANIDDCAPQPCQHGGLCSDKVNGFSCACLAGYRGARCETDIDECADTPCKHDAVCLQHSDVTLYRPPSAPAAPVLVGPQPHMLLPAYFYQPFSYDIAAGFECVCVAGTLGARCETNLDECASSPCAHGTCVDAVGGFSCDCLPGFEGELCEHEIDECVDAPCAHGRCVDLRADYLCVCEAGWGGRNCSVELTGCVSRPCRNAGVCTPYLRGDAEHAFNCSCAPGYHGPVCDKITTMSLERQSFAEVNTSREEGYDISFRFKTTLGSALLAMGRGVTYFFLELSNGRLNLHSSLLNKWEGVFIGSNLNDSNWQKVFVTINSSHVVLAANEEQTIYPISQNEVYNATVTSFPNTRLGTPGSSYAALTHGPDFFVGCFQDVVVNSHWVLPEDSNATEVAASGGGGGGEEARALLRGVAAACPRSPQCEPNPCRAAGVCTDAWSTFVCSCRRPHLGHTCQYNYTAATFGHESQPRRSRVTVTVSDAARRAVRAALDISMFIRTREPSGHIFYLGSLPRYGQTDETLVAASLKNGELLVHLRFNHTPEDYTVGGTRLDNAHLHLIEVVRNSTLVQVKLNGTEYFRKSISAAKQLDAQVLYLGGPPPIPQPPAPLPMSSPAPGASLGPPGASVPPGLPGVPGSTPATPAPTTPPPQEDYEDEDFFKGVIQDVQVSNGVNVTIVQLFPLVGADVALPAEFGTVRLPAAGVLPGQVSDAACASTPCRHGAPCVTTWNDYSCDCPRGYKGKQCADVEFCQLQGCPRHSLCRNLKQGYECIANATFDGVNTTLQYQLAAGLDPSIPVERPTRLAITYRSKLGGTLLTAVHNGSWFSVGVYRGRCTLQWKLGAAWPVARRLAAPAPPAPAVSATLRVTLHNGQILASFTDAEGAEEAGLAAPIDVEAWQQLMLHGTIYLGGVPRAVNLDTTEISTEGGVIEYTEGEEFPLDNVSGEYFKGCMGEVHVGSYLLPYFSAAELWGAAGAGRAPHYALRAGAPWGADEGVGCVLCLDALCQGGARCRDVRSDYACACPRGRAGDYCEIDIDECADAACANGATCVDGAANYTCVCAPGYSGPLCSEDIDECASSPCLNGGTCTDDVGAFRCECAGEWRGERCQLRARRSCQQRPCAPPAACTPRADPETGNNYTCECTEGFQGVHCELAFCDVTPCVHGRCRNDTTPPQCSCEAGWEGPLCALEVDACAAAAPPCLHGGRCVSHAAHATHSTPHCDCTGTGYEGARCETDVDECAAGLVSCGTGRCMNLDGSYTCICEAGFCGHDCLLRDPCFEPAPAHAPAAGETAGEGETAAGSAGEAGSAALGPCAHGGVCSQRCSAVVDYVCHCAAGWTGQNCTEPSYAAAGGWWGGAAWWAWLLALAALLALLGGGAALGTARARRQRATRGTYSPSGQEYRNPRALAHPALKPPPEERLI